jgi:hypothetical protein
MRPRIPENEDGNIGPVLSCKPTPYLECQLNVLTYLCVPGNGPQPSRLVLVLVIFIFIFIFIPFDASAIEKRHEGLWGQAKVL